MTPASTTSIDACDQIECLLQVWRRDGHGLEANEAMQLVDEVRLEELRK